MKGPTVWNPVTRKREPLPPNSPEVTAHNAAIEKQRRARKLAAAQRRCSHAPLCSKASRLAAKRVVKIGRGGRA